MRTIPQIRAEMREMADLYAAAGLQDLADVVREWEGDLYRRSPIRRAPSKDYVRPDPDAIRAYADAHPDMTYMDIALAYGCSTGRVSEALAGFRQDAWVLVDAPSY